MKITVQAAEFRAWERYLEKCLRAVIFSRRELCCFIRENGSAWADQEYFPSFEDLATA
jgi:hypothetical protein